MFSEVEKIYSYEPDRAIQPISVVSSLPQSDRRQLDIPAPETAAGVTFSIRATAAASYRLIDPTGRRFAEVFITVRRKVNAVCRAVQHFIRRKAVHLRMALALRRTVFLRL